MEKCVQNACTHLIFDCLFPVLCLYLYLFLFVCWKYPYLFSWRRRKKTHFERVNRITFNWKMTKMKTSYVLFIQMPKEIHTDIVCVLQCLSVVVSLTDNVHLLVSFFFAFYLLKTVRTWRQFFKQKKKNEKRIHSLRMATIVTKNGSNNGMFIVFCSVLTSDRHNTCETLWTKKFFLSFFLCQYWRDNLHWFPFW